MDPRFTPGGTHVSSRRGARVLQGGAARQISTRRRLPPEGATQKEDLVTWQRILNKKGWAVPHWPKEYGGTGWSPVQQYNFL